MPATAIRPETHSKVRAVYEIKRESPLAPWCSHCSVSSSLGTVLLVLGTAFFSKLFSEQSQPA